MNEVNPSSDFEVNRWNVRRDILQAKLAGAVIELMSHTQADALVVPVGNRGMYIAIGTADAITGMLLTEKPTVVKGN